MALCSKLECAVSFRDSKRITSDWHHTQMPLQGAVNTDNCKHRHDDWALDTVCLKVIKSYDASKPATEGNVKD